MGSDRWVRNSGRRPTTATSAVLDIHTSLTSNPHHSCSCFGITSKNVHFFGHLTCSLAPLTVATYDVISQSFHLPVLGRSGRHVPLAPWFMNLTSLLSLLLQTQPGSLWNIFEMLLPAPTLHVQKFLCQLLQQPRPSLLKVSRSPQFLLKFIAKLCSVSPPFHLLFSRLSEIQINWTLTMIGQMSICRLGISTTRDKLQCFSKLHHFCLKQKLKPKVSISYQVSIEISRTMGTTTVDLDVCSYNVRNKSNNQPEHYILDLVVGLLIVVQLVSFCDAIARTERKQRKHQCRKHFSSSVSKVRTFYFLPVKLTVNITIKLCVELLSRKISPSVTFTSRGKNLYKHWPFVSA